MQPLEKYYEDKDPASIPVPINKYISNLMCKTNNLEYTLEVLEEIKLILQKLKNTGVFSVLVSFVRQNSDHLLNGKIVDFTPIFTQIRNTVNNSIRDIYYHEEIELEKFGIQFHYNTDALRICKVQFLLMAEALSMCPELNVKHVLKIDDNEYLRQGIQINGGNNIY